MPRKSEKIFAERAKNDNKKMVKKFKIHKKAFMPPDKEKQDIPMSHKTRIRHSLRFFCKIAKWTLLLAVFFILFALGFWIYNWLRFRG